MAEGFVIIDKPVLDHFLGWSGPMGSDMRRRKRTLEFRSRSSAPRKTGKLKIGIKSRERTVTNGLQIEVGNFDGPRYAAAQHEGARAHIIHAKNAPALHFFWAKKQVFVTAKFVHHPGNPATHYLSRWLREAVR